MAADHRMSLLLRNSNRLRTTVEVWTLNAADDEQSYPVHSAELPVASSHVFVSAAVCFLRRLGAAWT